MDMSVGCRAVDVNDAKQGASVAMRLLYPTRTPERMEPFGPFTLNLAMDAPVEGEHLPLVIVSHGTGGTPWTHRDLASHLARSGFVVGLIQHPGNNRADDSLGGKAINLENRPRHVRLAIDAAFTDEVVGKHLSVAGVTVIGHSLGGYTALAVAGGKPSSFAWETPDGKAGPMIVDRDARVRALVLLAPATMWFMADGALDDVDLPILMRTGEKDAHTEVLHAQIVERGIRNPMRLDHKVIPNAGHFAFLSSYPTAMKSPAIPPSQDPEGFDRAAFLPVLFGEIVTFLRSALPSPPVQTARAATRRVV
jgi:predicted dienelactone hydrolase